MNNFTQRILSGAVYVAVVVSSILVHPIYFGAVFLIVSLLAVREYHHLLQSPRGLIVSSMIGGGWLFLTAFAHYFGNTLCGGCSCMNVVEVYMCLLYGIYAIVMLIVTLIRWQNRQAYSSWITGQLLVLCFGTMLALLHANPYLVLMLFITIWLNDSGAYCVGCLTAKRPQGNHKMAPTISPKKSWEGLIGGFVVALLAGWVFYLVGWMPSLWKALLMVLIIAVAGTYGDLVESVLKRQVGVKDSGKFMPGHGGVLDRFDSILLAAPSLLLVYLLLF